MSENQEPQCSASLLIETGDLKISVSVTGPHAVEDVEKLLDKALEATDDPED